MFLFVIRVTVYILFEPLYIGKLLQLTKTLELHQECVPLLAEFIYNNNNIVCDWWKLFHGLALTKEI